MQHNLLCNYLFLHAANYEKNQLNTSCEIYLTFSCIFDKVPKALDTKQAVWFASHTR